MNVTEEWLESVPRCPVCGGQERKVFAVGLRDINYAGVAGTWRFMRCLHCRSAYMDPRIDRQHIASAYVNYETHAAGVARPKRSGLSGFVQAACDAYVARRYGPSSSQMSVGMAWFGYLLLPLRLERDFAMRHARSKDGTGRALDVGCGNGDFLVRLRGIGWQAKGLDFDPAAVATARARGLDVALATVDGEEIKQGSYELVAASHVIEHVHDPVRFVRDLYARVAPGGTLWLATPNVDSPLRRIEGEYWVNWETPRHLQLFCVASLRRLIDQTLGGHADVRFKRRGWHVYWSMAQSARLRKGQHRGPRPQLPFWRLPLALLLEFAALTACRSGDELVVEIRKPNG